MILHERIKGGLTGLIYFIILHSLFYLLSGFYNKSPGWTEQSLLLFGDRFLYGLIVAFGGYLLYFHLSPVFAEHKDGEKNKRIKLSLFKNDSPLRSLTSGFFAGCFLFGFLLVFLHFKTPVKTSIFPGNFIYEFSRNRAGFWLYVITTGLLTPLFEETYYRGILQQFLMDHKIGPFSAIVLQTLCFIFLHKYNVMPILALLGLIFGILYWRLGLASSILAHTTYNLMILFHSHFSQASLK